MLANLRTKHLTQSPPPDILGLGYVPKPQTKAPPRFRLPSTLPRHDPTPGECFWRECEPLRTVAALREWEPPTSADGEVSDLLLPCSR